MLNIESLTSYITKNRLEDKNMNDLINDINNGYNICHRVLKNSYNAHGVKAGETHFSDVWIRDSSFACWGALEIGDTDIVKRFLTHVIDFMGDDGQCPLRIGQKYFLLKFFGLKGPQGPTFIEDKYVSVPMDSNSLVVILFFKYYQKYLDLEFIKVHYESFKKMVLWYDNHLVNELLVEGPYAGWADSVKKRGHVLYTNVLYYQSLCSISKIAKALGLDDDAMLFNEKSLLLKHQIIQLFWNGEFLDDWVYRGKVKDTFSVESNMLAILFDIVDRHQAASILQYVIDQKIISEFGLPVVYKGYKFQDVYTPFHLINLRDYHNGLIWFWISCISSVVFSKYGYYDVSTNLMDIMGKKIATFDTVYEVYEKNGQPLDRFFYKSERGFAWSAGLFVWACNQLGFATPR